MDCVKTNWHTKDFPRLSALDPYKEWLGKGLKLSYELDGLFDSYLDKASFALLHKGPPLCSYRSQVFRYLRSILTLRQCDYDEETHTLTDVGPAHLSSVYVESDFRMFLVHLNYLLKRQGFAGSDNIAARNEDERTYDSTLETGISEEFLPHAE